jgi:hypothetical protein
MTGAHRCVPDGHQARVGSAGLDSDDAIDDLDRIDAYRLVGGHGERAAAVKGQSES